MTNNFWAVLIGIYKYVDSERKTKVCMTFQNVNNPQEQPFQIDILPYFKKIKMTATQKRVNFFQSKLQGQLFYIEENGGRISIVDLEGRLRDCRS